MKILPFNIIFVFLISFFLISTYTFFSSKLELEYVFSANILNLSICIPLMIYIKKRVDGLLNPSLYFCLFFHISHLYFPFIYLTNYSDYGYTNMNYTINFSQESQAFYILSAAIIFFHIGFNLLKKIKLNSKNSFQIKDNNLLKIKNLVVYLYLFIVFFRLYQFYMGYRGSTFLIYNNVSESASFFYSISVFISNYWFLFFGYFSFMFFSKKIKNSHFYLIAIIEFLIIIFDSNRRLFINYSFILFLTYVYLNKRTLVLRFKHLFILCLSIIIFIFSTIMGFFLAIRGNSIFNFYDLYSYTLNFFESGQSIFNLIFVSIITSFNGNVVFNIAMNYFNGDWGPVGIINFIKQLIPSFIQENKYGYVRDFENLFGDFAFSNNVEYSYLSINQITALYLSYGTWGVIFGMFFIGMLMFIIYKTFLISNNDYRKIIYLSSFTYLSMYFNSSFIGGDIVFVLRFIIYFLILEYFIIGFLNLKKTNKL